MCGLVGIQFLTHRRSAEVWSELKKFFLQCFIFHQERGREASGVAVIKKSGSFLILKKPVPAEELVKTKSFELLMDTLDDDTALVLAHTRAPTKGDPQNYYNNHPLIIGQVIGIHNGELKNDDELFEWFGFPRRAEVDSEIIFWLLNSLGSISEKSLRFSLNQANQLFSFLNGSFTVMAVNINQPRFLWVIKKDRPLCHHFHREWGVRVFASRYLFLRRAFGRQVLAEALESEHIYLFDREVLGSQPLLSSPLKISSRGSSNGKMPILSGAGSTRRGAVS